MWIRVMSLLFCVAAMVSVLQAQTIPLDSPDQLKLVNVKAETVDFKGRKALRVLDAAKPGSGDEGRLVILPKTDFQDEQPTLLVNDLKQGQSRGAVALWIGTGTLAHFSNVRISP